ncbi:MAG: hypothetical protein N5P05_004573 [Chroococcopsis gigantea SAG 12.99]|nr:hypothetical protein [Chroococcopsis gigantea SAG 12.99]
MARDVALAYKTVPLLLIGAIGQIYLEQRPYGTISLSELQRILQGIQIAIAIF